MRAMGRTLRTKQMADQLSKSRQCPMSNYKLRLRDFCLFLLLGFKFLLIDTENKYVSSGVAKTLVDRAQGRCPVWELDLEPRLPAMGFRKTNLSRNAFRNVRAWAKVIVVALPGSMGGTLQKNVGPKNFRSQILPWFCRQAVHVGLWRVLSKNFQADFGRKRNCADLSVK